MGQTTLHQWKKLYLGRYKRLLEEDSPLPQLIVIDGGKGQLSSALKSLDIFRAKRKNLNFRYC